VIQINCQKCKLAKTRHKIVVGRGDSPATILFIGEAPGISEDILGQAFIGEAGKFLDAMIKEAGFDSIPAYFTNTILCRPCDARGGKNREPNNEEILTCMNNIIVIIKKVMPEYVVLVGDYAQRYYGKMFKDAVKITHPSALLKNGGKRAQGYRENIRKLACLIV
jgi:DNA polymerase